MTDYQALIVRLNDMINDAAAGDYLQELVELQAIKDIVIQTANFVQAVK